MTTPTKVRILDRVLPRSDAAHARLTGAGERYGLVIALAIIVAVFGALRPASFLTVANGSSILGSQAVLVVLTLGLLIALRAGEVDLSCAGVMVMSGIILASLNVRMGMPVVPAALIAIAIGALIGLTNGVIVTYFDLDSFVVTLGMETLLSGLALWVSGSETINGVSQSLTDYVSGTDFLRIPLAFWYGLIVCALVWYAFEHTSVGVRLLFVGRSRSVAQLSGITVRRVRVGSLVASGVLSALAGIIYTGTTGSADPSAGLSYLLPAFAGAFLGATAIRPGQFNAWGAFIAVYFLVTGITGLSILGLQTYVQPIFYGAALLIAVMMAKLSRRRTGQA